MKFSWPPDLLFRNSLKRHDLAELARRTNAAPPEFRPSQPEEQFT